MITKEEKDNLVIESNITDLEIAVRNLENAKCAILYVAPIVTQQILLKFEIIIRIVETQEMIEQLQKRLKNKEK